MKRRAVAVVVALAALPGCSDPVHDQAIDDLGGEAAGVEPGPEHRPGQPCLLCHDGHGSGGGEFSIAGTLYQRAGGRAPLVGALVRIIDSTGRQYGVRSNCAGNFIIDAGSFRPKYPIWTKIEYAGHTAEMISASFREGSCSACHQAEATAAAVAPITLVDENTEFSQGRCRRR